MNHKTTDILTGRYQGDRRGFGFFTPEGATGRGEDCFVPPHKELGAWDGDLVEVRVLPADHPENQPADVARSRQFPAFLPHQGGGKSQAP